MSPMPSPALGAYNMETLKQFPSSGFNLVPICSSSGFIPGANFSLENEHNRVYDGPAFHQLSHTAGFGGGIMGDEASPNTLGERGNLFDFQGG